jgi:hypothetical protein
MICKINTVSKLHTYPTYTKEEKIEIAENIQQYAKLKRIEYSYTDGDDVYISDCKMTATRKAWLNAMARQIYRPSSTSIHGIKTTAQRAQQILHRRKTPQGKKVQ